MHFEGLAALEDESRAGRREESLGDIGDHAFSRLDLSDKPRPPSFHFGFPNGLSLSPKGKATGHESSGLIRLLKVPFLRVSGPLIKSNKSHINVSGCWNDSIRPGQLQPNSPVSVFTKKRTDQGILSQAPRPDWAKNSLPGS